jgi:hypothetical protein
MHTLQLSYETQSQAHPTAVFSRNSSSGQAPHNPKPKRGLSKSKDWRDHGVYAMDLLLVLALMALVFFTGCDKPKEQVPVVPVSGKLTVNGKPAAGALVVLHPASGGLPTDVRPNAYAGKDGSFQLNTYAKGDGAPVGDYVVTVEWRQLEKKQGQEPQLGPNLAPKEYAKFNTSKLKASVPDGGTDLGTLAITGQGARTASQSSKTTFSE